jgi:hypothetical protein
MAKVPRTGLFARLNLRDQDTFLDIMPSDETGELRVDNPDGVVQAFGLGPYAVGPERGREYSEGAGTRKGNLGNASGQGRTMRLKGGTSRGSR